MRGFPEGYGARAGLRKLTAAFILGASAAGAEPVTILALGDSLTAGYGLPAGEGLVPQLSDWLTAQGHQVELINAGVSGDTTAGGLARVDWVLTDDVDAMIVALGGNDLLRGIDPAASRANLDGILQIAAARGLDVLLVGLTATGNFGPAFNDQFNAMYPELAEAYDAALYPDFFASIAGDGTTAQSLQSYMQPDGIHPNAAGVAAIVEDLGPAVRALADRATDG